VIEATSALVLELSGDESNAHVLGAQVLVKFHAIDVVGGGHGGEVYIVLQCFGLRCFDDIKS